MALDLIRAANAESDPIRRLIQEALKAELDHVTNPYLSYETLVFRLYKKMFDMTRVSFVNPSDKTLHFSLWHPTIFATYESSKSKMSYDEKVHVERVLSKDQPNPNELIKFACCWYKYHPTKACRLFAVDGILGNHPKVYVNDAFSVRFVLHNDAVRYLYDCPLEQPMDPELMKRIVEEAFARNEDDYDPDDTDSDSDFSRMVDLYADRVEEEEMSLVAADRRDRVRAQRQHPPKKRKKIPESVVESPSPSSP